MSEGRSISPDEVEQQAKKMLLQACEFYSDESVLQAMLRARGTVCDLRRALNHQYQNRIRAERELQAFRALVARDPARWVEVQLEVEYGAPERSEAPLNPIPQSPKGNQNPV